MATPAHNLTALLLGTAEFSFAEGALSAADGRAKGYVDFGNVVAFTIQPEIEKVELEGLKPGTQYAAVVEARSVGGASPTAVIRGAFETAPAANKKPGIIGPSPPPPRPTPRTRPEPEPSKDEG